MSKNTITSSGIVIGSNIIRDSTYYYSTISDLSDTTLDFIGITNNFSNIYFTNDNIIFGGGGNTRANGRDAFINSSGTTITALYNFGFFCGGGAGGALYASRGGAGGGGGGGNANSQLPAGSGGNGLYQTGNAGPGGAGGGGGGFNANGGGGTGVVGGSGTLAGGGCGMSLNGSGNATSYGGGGADTQGGGGAGGGAGGPQQTFGGGGGGGGGYASGYFSNRATTFAGNGGYGIYNNGIISLLENAQGIGLTLGALFYAGNLPLSYNIIIQNDASFGQLFYTGWSNLTYINSTITPVPGSLANFNISSSSSNIKIGKSYDAVLVNINPAQTSGSNGLYNWSLNYVQATNSNSSGKIVKIGNIFYPSYDLIINSISICFLENSKILTVNGYLPIQNLRKGHLIKTLKNGFKKIHSIGKKEFYHVNHKERNKNQLYNCSKSSYPELWEDLVLTGCHSILKEKFTSIEEKEKTIEVNGDLYITDDLIRLPVCVDERSEIYAEEGLYMVYHLALENENIYTNYGIYANGLLVESTSIWSLEKNSRMELIE
jgi:hypothetical protein